MLVEVDEGRGAASKPTRRLRKAGNRGDDGIEDGARRRRNAGVRVSGAPADASHCLHPPGLCLGAFRSPDRATRGRALSIDMSAIDDANVFSVSSSLTPFLRL